MIKIEGTADRNNRDWTTLSGKRKSTARIRNKKKTKERRGQIKKKRREEFQRVAGVTVGIK